MSIFKDTFRDYVRRQLILREELIDIGNTSDNGSRTNRLKSYPIKTPKGDINLNAGAFYNYSLNRQCVIRMTSLVDYVFDVGLELGGLSGDESFNSLKGASLSQNFILQGGVLSDFARTRKDGTIKTRRFEEVRQSFRKPGLKTNISYGDFAIGSNATSDGYGIVPMPGIIDATIRTKSAYGSLREAKINFECHNQKQLEVLEMLYMRPGYQVLVEWGWCPYINNNGGYENNLRLAENATNNRIYTNNISQQEVFNTINHLKETQNGNYDGFLGFVKNFGFQAREDGGYSCYTELISIGEILDSLKGPSISTMNPFLGPSMTIDELENSKVVISNTYTREANKKTRYREKTVTNQVNAGVFNEVFDKGIFPQYNALEGLTKSIRNYATFNSFTLAAKGGTSNITADDKVYEKQLEEIFPGYNDKIERVDEDDSKAQQKETQAKRDRYFKYQEARNTSTKAGDNYSTNREFFRDILRFQASTLENVLLKKFNLNTTEELRNFIIPRGGVWGSQDLSNPKYKSESAQRRVKNKFGEFKNNEPYIRWDALATLINSTLIPKNETLKNSINIVTDRIYDLDNNVSRLDPLLFASITTIKPDTGGRTAIDFSTDVNTCILPLQLKKGNTTLIENILGYLPNINQFSPTYSQAVYEKDLREIKYNNSVLDPNTRLIDADAARRIGNIYLNINMIDEIASKNSDDPDYTIGNFITDIWDRVNKACPNHNFVLTDDKESNNIFIIDLPVDKENGIPNDLDLHTFIPFSNKNILRSFEYTSNVPSALTSTIAIQAQDPRSIQDIDGVTFAAFNKAIKNRILSEDTTPTWTRTVLDIQSQKSQLLTKRTKLFRQINDYQNNFFRNLNALANDNEIRGGNIKGILRDFQSQETYINEALGKGSSFTAVIPLEFSATLDGISGIVIGNMFKIKKDRLPKAYAKTNIGFIVFNEEQKITAGGDWTTDISGKMVIIDKPKGNSDSIFSQVPTTPEEALNKNANIATGEQAEALGAVSTYATTNIVFNVAPKVSTALENQLNISYSVTQPNSYPTNLATPTVSWVNQVGNTLDGYFFAPITNQEVGRYLKGGLNNQDFSVTVNAVNLEFSMGDSQKRGTGITDYSYDFILQDVPAIKNTIVETNKIIFECYDIGSVAATVPGVPAPPSITTGAIITVEFTDGGTFITNYDGTKYDYRLTI